MPAEPTTSAVPDLSQGRGDRPATAQEPNPFWGPDWPEVRELWPLEPTVAHLNHGSFGAVPRSVLEEQQSWRDRMEVNPVRFFRRELAAALSTARGEVADSFGAQEESLAFVSNATSGAGTVLASFPIEAGDRVLLTDHSYGAVAIAAQRFVPERGGVLDTVAVPLAADDAEVVERVLAAVVDRTRLVVLDHITSPTARRLPVEQLIPALQDRDIAVLVDGAHAPGMIEVRLDDLGADFYVGNLHKWVCAPRGTAVLHVAPRWRSRVRPLVASWGEADGFPAAFDETGTEDATAWLSAPRALRALQHLGLERLRAHNVALVGWGQRLVANALGLSPADLSVPTSLSMALVPLPAGVASSTESALALQTRLGEESSVEVTVVSWGGQGLLRVSAQAYNCPGDFHRLADELPALL